MKKRELISTIVKYSLLFIFLMSILVFLFIKYNKSFVWINVSNDGLDQHLINLHFFKDLLTTFFQTGTLPTFTWQIGFGMDMFANLAYYILGDFLSYSAILVSHDKLDILYNILIIVRVYLVGISFIIYCHYKKIASFPTIVGSIMYTFSSFVLFTMARHPYFINPLIVFPLLLLATELIILKKKKIFFIIIVSLMFISSFYFGCMMSLWIIPYGIIIAFNHYKKQKIKIIITKLLTTFKWALLGVMISSFCLIPTVIALLNSPRIGNYLYLYTPLYYKNLFISLISTNNTGNWSLIGVCSIILVILPIFIQKRKEYKNLFLFGSLLIIPLLIPFVATIFHCMSYPNNRWSFIVSFVLSFITASILNKDYEVNLKKTLLFIGGYALVIFVLYQKLNTQLLISLICGVLFAIVIKYKQKLNKLYKPLSILLLILNLGYNIFYMYDSHHYGYIDEFVSKDANQLYTDANGQIPYLDEAVKYLKEIDSGYYNTIIYPNYLYNLSLINDYNSISYFYSIVSSNYLDLASDLENQELGINKEIRNFNFRTKITTLLNLKYIITTDINYVPFGYEQIKNFDETTYIYKNNYYTSFAHLYTSYIEKEEYEKLSPLEKENALLNTTILENNNLLNYKVVDNSSIKSHDYTIVNEDIINDKTIQIDTLENNILNLSVEDIKDSEVYLYIKNLQFKNNASINFFGTYAYEITVNILNKSFIEGVKDYRTNAYYFENNDILINLGYYDELQTSIQLAFNELGTYSFEALEILLVSFDDYESTITNLNAANFELIDYDNNYLKGSVNCITSGVLQFSTNYSANWKVYVDGEKVETFTSNKYFLGINITEGYHEVYLVYESSINKISLLLSLLGIIMLTILIIYERRSKIEKN